MNRVTIDEATMRQLVATHRFYEIARMYKCDVRLVGRLAQQYGLRSAFVAKAATAEEEARVRELLAAGWSVKAIAEELGRSQDFVQRRMEACDDVDDDESGEGDAPLRTGWPIPHTTAEAALCGRRYDDVREEILDRECPPFRWPLNGAALAAAARNAAVSFSRSAADLCMEE
jgi:hypothetical protein